MTQENVEIVRNCVDAWRRGDLEACLSYYHPEVTWRDAPPQIGLYRGREGVVRAMEQWVEAFTDYWLEADDFVDAGDQVVLVWRQGGKRKTSGVAVENQGATVLRVEGGRIVSVRMFVDQDEALEAVGMWE
jgi:ketosteroid isomerase-like protein